LYQGFKTKYELIFERGLGKGRFMRIKIWGARGSIPTPIRADEVREKIVSAILNVAKVKNNPFREK